MGHALMDKVLLQWSDLPGNAYKVVMLMAASTRDDTEKPVYWGGWERLAIAGMGRRSWPADDDESAEAAKRRKSHWEAVRSALAAAKKAGVISVKKRGQPGTRAEYWLHLDRPNTGKACVTTQDKPADPQEKPAVAQENPAPNYPYSSHSSGSEITSSPPVPHQGLESPRAKAHEAHIRLVRAQADEQATA